MRDIKRIDRICKKLSIAWKMFPDERLGQFFMNHIFNDGKDPFFKEDENESWMNEDYETWEDRIDNLIKRCKNENK